MSDNNTANKLLKKKSSSISNHNLLLNASGLGSNNNNANVSNANPNQNAKGNGQSSPVQGKSLANVASSGPSGSYVRVWTKKTTKAPSNAMSKSITLNRNQSNNAASKNNNNDNSMTSNPSSLNNFKNLNFSNSTFMSNRQQQAPLVNAVEDYYRTTAGNVGESMNRNVFKKHPQVAAIGAAEMNRSFQNSVGSADFPTSNNSSSYDFNDKRPIDFIPLKSGGGSLHIISNNNTSIMAKRRRSSVDNINFNQPVPAPSSNDDLDLQSSLSNQAPMSTTMGTSVPDVDSINNMKRNNNGGNANSMPMVNGSAGSLSFDFSKEQLASEAVIGKQGNNNPQPMSKVNNLSSPAFIPTAASTKPQPTPSQTMGGAIKTGKSSNSLKTSGSSVKSLDVYNSVNSINNNINVIDLNFPSEESFTSPAKAPTPATSKVINQEGTVKFNAPFNLIGKLTGMTKQPANQAAVANAQAPAPGFYGMIGSPLKIANSAVSSGTSEFNNNNNSSNNSVATRPHASGSTPDKNSSGSSVLNPKPVSFLSQHQISPQASNGQGELKLISDSIGSALIAPIAYAKTAPKVVHETARSLDNSDSTLDAKSKAANKEPFNAMISIESASKSKSLDVFFNGPNHKQAAFRASPLTNHVILGNPSSAEEMSATTVGTNNSLDASKLLVQGVQSDGGGSSLKLPESRTIDNSGSAIASLDLVTEQIQSRKRDPAKLMEKYKRRSKTESEFLESKEVHGPVLGNNDVKHQSIVNIIPSTVKAVAIANSAKKATSSPSLQLLKKASLNNVNNLFSGPVLIPEENKAIVSSTLHSSSSTKESLATAIDRISMDMSLNHSLEYQHSINSRTSNNANSNLINQDASAARKTSSHSQSHYPHVSNSLLGINLQGADSSFDVSMNSQITNPNFPDPSSVIREEVNNSTSTNPNPIPTMYFNSAMNASIETGGSNGGGSSNGMLRNFARTGALTRDSTMASNAPGRYEDAQNILMFMSDPNMGLFSDSSSHSNTRVPNPTLPVDNTGNFPAAQAMKSEQNGRKLAKPTWFQSVLNLPLAIIKDIATLPRRETVLSLKETIQRIEYLYGNTVLSNQILALAVESYISMHWNGHLKNRPNNISTFSIQESIFYFFITITIAFLWVSDQQSQETAPSLGTLSIVLTFLTLYFQVTRYLYHGRRGFIAPMYLDCIAFWTFLSFVGDLMEPSLAAWIFIQSVIRIQTVDRFIRLHLVLNFVFLALAFFLVKVILIPLSPCKNIWLGLSIPSSFSEAACWSSISSDYSLLIPWQITIISLVILSLPLFQLVESLRSNVLSILSHQDAVKELAKANDALKKKIFKLERREEAELPSEGESMLSRIDLNSPISKVVKALSSVRMEVISKGKSNRRAQNNNSGKKNANAKATRELVDESGLQNNPNAQGGAPSRLENLKYSSDYDVVMILNGVIKVLTSNQFYEVNLTGKHVDAQIHDWLKVLLLSKDQNSKAMGEESTSKASSAVIDSSSQNTTPVVHRDSNTSASIALRLATAAAAYTRQRSNSTTNNPSPLKGNSSSISAASKMIRLSNNDEQSVGATSLSVVTVHNTNNINNSANNLNNYTRSGSAILTNAEEIRALFPFLHQINFDTVKATILTRGRPLVFCGSLIFQHYLQVHSNYFQSRPISLEALDNLLVLTESRYRPEVPYHNSAHAADVLQYMHYLIQSSDRLRRSMHPEEILSALLACIWHDMCHPGVNNPFLVQTGHPLALRYNDTAVLENYHASQGFFLLLNSGNNYNSTNANSSNVNNPESNFEDDFLNLGRNNAEDSTASPTANTKNVAKDLDCNILANFSKSSFRVIRENVIGMILATDMSMHFDYINRFRNKMESDTSFDLAPLFLPPPMNKGTSAISLSAGKQPNQASNNSYYTFPQNYSPSADRKLLLQMLMKACDVSNGTRPWEISRKWTLQIMEEFFRQGDAEKAIINSYNTAAAANTLPPSVSVNTSIIPSVSVFMAREGTDISKCQVSFIDYVVRPLFEPLEKVLLGNLHPVSSKPERNASESSLSGGGPNNSPAPNSFRDALRNLEDNKRRWASPDNLPLDNYNLPLQINGDVFVAYFKTASENNLAPAESEYNIIPTNSERTSTRIRKESVIPMMTLEEGGTINSTGGTENTPTATSPRTSVLNPSTTTTSGKPHLPPFRDKSSFYLTEIIQSLTSPLASSIEEATLAMAAASPATLQESQNEEQKLEINGELINQSVEKLRRNGESNESIDSNVITSEK